MAKEAYYFSHDSNARNDDKIIALRMKLGWEGYGLFWAIIERLRESTNYTSVKDYNLIAFDLRSNASIIKSIINDFGLFTFTECGERFYSERLMKSMSQKDIKSEKARESAEKRWRNNKSYTDDLQTHSDSNANALQTHSDSNANKGKEKKEKENRVCVDAPNGDTPKSFKQFSKSDFKTEVGKHLETFGKNLCNEFFSYWTEPNANGKMKFQLEKTWDTKRRLENWKRNDDKFGNKTITQTVKVAKVPDGPWNC